MLTGLSTFGIGRLTSDAVTKNSGVCNFWLATNRKFTRKDGVEVEKTSFYWCSVFGKTAELCRNLKKGEAVHVTGDIDIEKWTGQDGVEKPVCCVSVSRISFLTQKQSPDPAGEPEPGNIPF
jgi:single-strand DNA-binding protein